jgi:hypothetical protein
MTNLALWIIAGLMAAVCLTGSSRMFVPRVSARRRPPPCGRMTPNGGTTRRNIVHDSSGTNRSIRSVMHGSTSDSAIRSDV